MSTASILQELEHTALARRLIGLDSSQVKNAFFANYLAALVMLRLQDLKGLLLVNDPAHAKLSRFAPGMSDLNFWGRAMFHPTDELVRKTLQHGHADILALEAGRIVQSRIEKTMSYVHKAPEQLNWSEVVAGLVLLKHRYEVNSTYFNNITRALNKWDTLNEGGKRRAVNDAFMYLMQSDKRSNLLGRMRELSGSTMMNDIKAAGMKLVSFSQLKEDGEAVSTANVGTTGGSNNAILTRGQAPASSKDGAYDPSAEESHEQVMDRIKAYKKASKHEKLIKKRKKAFKVVRFRAPEHMQVKRG